MGKASQVILVFLADHSTGCMHWMVLSENSVLLHARLSLLVADLQSFAVSPQTPTVKKVINIFVGR